MSVSNFPNPESQMPTSASRQSTNDATSSQKDLTGGFPADGSTISPAGPSIDQAPPEAAQFEKLMENQEIQESQTNLEAQNSLELARDTESMGSEQERSLQGTFNKTVDSFDKANNAIESALKDMEQYNFDLPASKEILLKGHINKAADGLEFVSDFIEKKSEGNVSFSDSIKDGEPSAKDLKNMVSTPLKNFFSYITNSQDRINAMNGEISQMGEKGQIGPADMLKVQVKMNKVQREVETFTNLLTKAIESTKTLMNVQI